MKILYLPNEYSQQRQREKKRMIYPVHLAMEAEWHRRNGDEVYWDEWNTANPIYKHGIDRKFDKVISGVDGIPFLELPPPNRLLSNAFDKRYQQNGNFKYHPGTYIQVASSCWWGKCSFCCENGKKYEVRPVDSVMAEIEECARLGFKELFDDSGTFPVGSWLHNFCEQMRRFNNGKKRITMGCNMRAGVLKDEDWHALRSAGFRLILLGLESANETTLKKINKGVAVSDVIRACDLATKNGLEVHVTSMFGYPWESDAEAEETLKLVHHLLRKGLAKTAQASFYQPPDGINNEKHRKYVPRIYDVAYSLEFWWNKLRDIKDWDDVRYLGRQIREGISSKI